MSYWYVENNAIPKSIRCWLPFQWGVRVCVWDRRELHGSVCLWCQAPKSIFQSCRKKKGTMNTNWEAAYSQLKGFLLHQADLGHLKSTRKLPVCFPVWFTHLVTPSTKSMQICVCYLNLVNKSSLCLRCFQWCKYEWRKYHHLIMIVMIR